MDQPGIEISDHKLCLDCGNCCKVFSLTKEPEEMLKTPRSNDRMVKWLKEDVIEVNGDIAEGILNPTQIQHFGDDKNYTCRLLGEDGKCTDYENRPGTCIRYPGHYRDNDVLVDWEGRNPYLECPLLDQVLDEEYQLREKFEYDASDKGLEKEVYDGYRKIVKSVEQRVDEEGDELKAGKGDG